MYKWKLVFTLNNGKVIEGVYHGDEINSGDVVKKILGQGQREHTFFGFADKTGTHNIVVYIGNVDAIDVSVYTE